MRKAVTGRITTPRLRKLLHRPFRHTAPPATPACPHLGFVLDGLIDAADAAVVVDPVHEPVRVPVDDAVNSEERHGHPPQEQDNHEEDIRAASVGPAFDVIRGDELDKTRQGTGEEKSK